MTNTDEIVLQLTDVVKTFPGVRALDGVQLEVRAGEVHCLLGQNGAGKSTLIKVLSGAHTPDSGEILWQGQPATFNSPQTAMKAGIATIYQELDLVDGLSVAENIYLGHEKSRFGFSQRRSAAASMGVRVTNNRSSGAPGTVLPCMRGPCAMTAWSVGIRLASQPVHAGGSIMSE